MIGGLKVNERLHDMTSNGVTLDVKNVLPKKKFIKRYNMHIILTDCSCNDSFN